MDPIKVVVRYADGRIIKGSTNDFFPNKPVFHLHPLEAEAADKGVEINVRELKAIFFVKDFTGNAAYNERRHFADGEKPSGRKIEVTFRDGELLVGATMGYDASRPGFFVVPTDPQSNNLRIFVVTAAVKGTRYL